MRLRSVLHSLGGLEIPDRSEMYVEVTFRALVTQEQAIEIEQWKDGQVMLARLKVSQGK